MGNKEIAKQRYASGNVPAWDTMTEDERAAFFKFIKIKTHLFAGQYVNFMQDLNSRGVDYINKLYAFMLDLLTTLGIDVSNFVVMDKTDDPGACNFAAILEKYIRPELKSGIYDTSVYYTSGVQSAYFFPGEMYLRVMQEPNVRVVDVKKGKNPGKSYCNSGAVVVRVLPEYADKFPCESALLTIWEPTTDVKVMPTHITPFKLDYVYKVNRPKCELKTETNARWYPAGLDWGLTVQPYQLECVGLDTRKKF
jgi:hypothetical protein